ncbi:MAG: preprotein translocase subunit YajC [Bacteroidales bacterium]|nr:preprotein translocase subunit YajC [Bacteroidales bacterium]
MNALFSLLMAPADGQAGGMGNGSMTLIFILLLILIFYFFMIRPQQKKQKQIEEFRSKLAKGDKIVTIGGLHGKIVEVNDATFVVEIADGVRITIEKAAVSIDENAAKKANN